MYQAVGLGGVSHWGLEVWETYREEAFHVHEISELLWHVAWDET